MIAVKHVRKTKMTKERRAHFEERPYRIESKYIAGRWRVARVNKRDPLDYAIVGTPDLAIGKC